MCVCMYTTGIPDMTGPPGGKAGQWFRGCLGTFFGPMLSLRPGSWSSQGMYFRASWRFIFTRFSTIEVYTYTHIHVSVVLWA